MRPLLTIHNAKKETTKIEKARGLPKCKETFHKACAEFENRLPSESRIVVQCEHRASTIQSTAKGLPKPE